MTGFLRGWVWQRWCRLEYGDRSRRYLTVFACRNSLLASDGGKIIQKRFDRISCFEMVDKILERHSGTSEHDGSSLHLRI